MLTLLCTQCRYLFFFYRKIKGDIERCTSHVVQCLVEAHKEADANRDDIEKKTSEKMEASEGKLQHMQNQLDDVTNQLAHITTLLSQRNVQMQPREGH